MPRASAEEKSRSRERILAAASVMMRDRGLEGTAIGDVMAAAGMTHGGFYKHFRSREEMLGVAMDFATEAVLASVEAGRTTTDHADAIDRYVAQYLSESHRQDRANGCPLAAIAGEALRQDGAVRDAAERALARTVEFLSGTPAKADGKGATSENGIATAIILIGTIILSRLARDESEAERILAVGEKTVRMVREGCNKN